MNNEQVMQLMADNGMHEGGMDNWVIDNAWFKFANLVAAQEREAWEHKFARLQNLMDIRETQPNKPCCIAARAEEREECAKLIEESSGTGKLVSCMSAAAAIRARGTT